MALFMSPLADLGYLNYNVTIKDEWTRKGCGGRPCKTDLPAINLTATREAVACLGHSPLAGWAELKHSYTGTRFSEFRWTREFIRNTSKWEDDDENENCKQIKYNYCE